MICCSPLVEIFGINSKKVIIKNFADTEELLGSNRAATEYSIYVIAAARQLACKPYNRLSLIVQLFPNDFADDDNSHAVKCYIAWFPVCEIAKLKE